MKRQKPDVTLENASYEQYVKMKGVFPGLCPIPYDEEAFRKNDIGRRNEELHALYDTYAENPLHPDLLRYWADRGLKKELFDSDGKTGFEAPCAYSVFTPLSMDKNKKYALIYFSHGGGHSIEWAETYGFNTQAAAERYIIVYAQNGGRFNDAAPEEFPRILESLKHKDYPIDWERVYAVGFSSGSEATARIAAAYPHMVAAVGCLPGGIPFKNINFAADPTMNKLKKYRMPGIFIGGTLDKGNFPAQWMNQYAGYGLPVGSLENAVDSLNAWLTDVARAENAEPLSVCEIMKLLNHSDDPVEREFGIRFPEPFQFCVQDANWLGGDFYGEKHVPVMRWIRACDVPHLVWESQAELVWDYLKHFRRNIQSGESIYDPVVCWGER